MDCNKEEALRAKEIAEKKMQIKDFVGAKKIVLKAQQLFSDLDNISQMLTVCEVHCCSGVRVNGEMDWYGILQVEQTADESSIKKQYRKLALLLHPDKNKFAGAEAAFKLIGEAHMTLSDRAKRSIYDKKRITNTTMVMPRQPAQNPNMTSFARRQPGVQNSYTSTGAFHYSNVNQQRSSGCQNQTFWTMCTNCCMKFQYFRNLLNKSIRCHSCMANYVASELNEQPVPHPTSANQWNQNHNFKQQVPVQASDVGNSSYRTGFQVNVAGGSSSGINMAHGNGGFTSKQKEDVVPGGKGGAGNEAKPAKVKRSTVNAPRKKSRKMVIESSDSDSSTDGEDEVVEDGLHGEEQNAGTSSGRYPRRSCRVKQNVTYNERGVEDDDDFVSPSKRLRKAGASHGADHVKAFPGAARGVPSNANDGHRNDTSGESLPNGGESVKKFKVHEDAQGQGAKEEIKSGTRSNANSATNSASKTSPDVRSFSFPDPEFYDFEQERDPSKFAADQIWAIYDDLDAMPRYYARIREVFSPFRLRFTWLEYDPITGPEDVWKLEKLPVACGNYRVGKSAFTKDLQMFSHQICWDKGTNRNTYAIYPRKGETWALFKGWDARWSSDANSHRLYKYEVVEILSDLSDGGDFQVVHLLKVLGFMSLFVRSTPNGKFQISPAEVLRFSHRVPSYRMSEGEREGVPEGSFELDIASLPSIFGETFPSVSLNTASVKAQKLDPEHSDLHHGSTSGDFPSAVNKESMKLNENDMEKTGSKGHSSKGAKGVPGNENISVAAECPASPSMPPPSPTSPEYLESEFHDFHKDRSIEKFQRGQIWALYSDIDQQPKFYAKIKKVDFENIVVSASWVELCPRGQDEDEWKKKDLPAACGRFKVDRKMQTFETTEIFSHLVQAEPIMLRRDEYDIYPRSGEVWALYKNWSMGWTCLDLEKCEFYLVEILEVADSVVKVQVLTKVAEYNVVFMPEMIEGVEHKIELSMHENLRFSHQIPAFRLSDEVDGALRGYWELDPLSVPPSCI